MQRLRHRVFAEDLGASLPGHDGLDADEFDVCCDHIVVRDDRTGEAVGTYRMLPPERGAAAAGGTPGRQRVRLGCRHGCAPDPHLHQDR